MTRTTNARIAGFTYLFYAAIGICLELLMHQATAVDGDSAKLARIGEYATNVRVAILITLLECFSALVLAVTLYGITRVQDHELAMLALVCRVAEGVLGSLNIPRYLGLLWLAKAGVGAGAPDIPTTNALRAFLLMPGPSVPIGSIFFAWGVRSFPISSCADGWCPFQSHGWACSRRACSWCYCPCSSPVSPQGR
jgi:hypothetical protein